MAKKNQDSFVGSVHSNGAVIAQVAHIHGGLANYPRLALRLAGSPDNGYCVAIVRDRNQDCKEEIVIEASRNGIPDFEWVAKATSPITRRLEKARKHLESEVADEPERIVEWWSLQSELSTPRNEKEKYGLAARKWYEQTVMRLLYRHRAETYIARSIVLNFDIVNEGRSPAENVAVELYFPSELSLQEEYYRESTYSTPAVPPLPPKLQKQLITRFPVRDVGPTTWYTFPAPESLPSRDNLFKAVRFTLGRQNDMQVAKYWTVPKLEHGDSNSLRAIRIGFNYDPAQDLNIRYRLHASNQPEDIHGQLLIPVREDNAGRPN